MQRRQSFYNATDFTRCECAKSCKIRWCDPSRLASSAKWRAVRPSAAPVWGSTPRSRRIRRIGTSPICAATWMGYINSKRTFPGGEASRKQRQRWVYRNHQNLQHPATMWIIISPWLSNVDFWFEDSQEKRHERDRKYIQLKSINDCCLVVEPHPLWDSHNLATRPSRIRIYSSEEQPQWLFFNRASRYSFFWVQPCCNEEAWCIISAASKINIVSTHGHLEKIMKKTRSRPPWCSHVSTIQ